MLIKCTNYDQKNILQFFLLDSKYFFKKREKKGMGRKIYIYIVGVSIKQQS